MAKRSGKYGRWLELQKDPKQPSHIKGWIQQELNRDLGYIRNPPRYQLAHWRGSGMKQQKVIVIIIQNLN